MAEITNALAAMETSLGKELVRLRALQRVNLSIRDEEIRALEDELNALRKVLPLAHTRLDAIRFVCSADFLSLR
jgi:ATP-dependent helicase HepA